jgi:hypothetical protein
VSSIKRTITICNIVKEKIDLVNESRVIEEKTGRISAWKVDFAVESGVY